MNRGRTKRLIASWWRRYERFQKLSFDHFEIMVDNETFYEPEDLAECGWDQEEARRFIEKRRVAENNSKILAFQAAKRLHHLEKSIPAWAIQELQDLWHERENARLNRRIEQMKRKGLAVNLSNGSLVTFGSHEYRRQWEQEHPEQAALIVNS